MPALDRQSVVSRNPGLIWTHLEREVVLVDVELSDYYRMNPSGSRVWELLEEPRSVEELVQGIVARYRVDPAPCAADLMTFLQELAGAGVVTWTPAPGAAAEPAPL